MSRLLSLPRVSRQTLAIVGLVLASVACAVYVGGAGWVWLGAAVTFLALGAGWPILCIWALRGEVSAATGRLDEGQSLVLDLDLRNRIPLPLVGVQLHWGDQRLALPAIASGRSSHRLAIASMTRGEHPDRTLCVWCSFPFGLLARSRPVNVARRAFVWPTRHPAGSAPESGGARVDAGTRARLAAVGEQVGLRDYRRGDSPRQIHWAATARLGRLVAFERAETTRARLRVTLDVASFAGGASGPQSGYEHALRAAAGVVDAWTRAGASLVFCCGHDHLTINSPADLPRVFDSLAALPAVVSSATRACGIDESSTLVIVASTRPVARSIRAIRLDPGVWPASNPAVDVVGDLPSLTHRLLTLAAHEGVRRAG